MFYFDILANKYSYGISFFFKHPGLNELNIHGVSTFSCNTWLNKFLALFALTEQKHFHDNS